MLGNKQQPINLDEQNQNDNLREENQYESQQQKQKDQDYKHLIQNLMQSDSIIEVSINPEQTQKEAENQLNQMINQPQQSRPSPNQQSYSISNPISKQTKTKPLPLSSELLRLTKKTTSTSVKQSQRKERQKKVRYYVTNFQPYLPNFLDQMHRQHHKNIVKIGENYQVNVPNHPQFQKIYRPMNHLKVWKGSSQEFSSQAFKKFKDLYGQNRTQEDFILLKHRLQIDNWNDLIKQISVQKNAGKKSTLLIGNNNLNAAATRSR